MRHTLARIHSEVHISRTVSEGELSLSVRDFPGSLRTNEPVILDPDGDMIAVKLSREEYARLFAADQEERDRLWAVVDRVRERNAHLDPDEVLRDVTAIVEEVRKERHDQRRSDQSGR